MTTREAVPGAGGPGGAERSGSGARPPGQQTHQQRGTGCSGGRSKGWFWPLCGQSVRQPPRKRGAQHLLEQRPEGCSQICNLGSVKPEPDGMIRGGHAASVLNGGPTSRGLTAMLKKQASPLREVKLYSANLFQTKQETLTQQQSLTKPQANHILGLATRSPARD